MSCRDDIIRVQTTAMKEKNQPVLSTVRMLLAAVKNADIEKGEPLGDEGVAQIVTRQIKQLRDATSEFEKGGRADLVEQTKQEIDVLSQFLPPQLSNEALTEVVKRTIERLQPQGPKDMGKVVGAVMKEVNGSADGTRVREAVTVALG